MNGTGLVVKVDDGKPGERMVNTDALLTRCTLHLEVSAKDVEPITVRWKGMVKASKWPRRGVKLPVTFERSNPERLEINWDEAPSVVKNLIGGTEADLTPEQRQETERIQAKTLENQDELQKIVEQWRKGEIDQDELMRRQAEIMGEG